MSAAGEVAVLRAEVVALGIEVDAMRRVVDLFYEAGRADALNLPPRVRRASRLTVVKP